MPVTLFAGDHWSWPRRGLAAPPSAQSTFVCGDEPLRGSHLQGLQDLQDLPDLPDLQALLLRVVCETPSHVLAWPLYTPSSLVLSTGKETAADFLLPFTSRLLGKTFHLDIPRIHLNYTLPSAIPYSYIPHAPQPKPLLPANLVSIHYRDTQNLHPTSRMFATGCAHQGPVVAPTPLLSRFIR